MATSGKDGLGPGLRRGTGGTRNGARGVGLRVYDKVRAAADERAAAAQRAKEKGPSYTGAAALLMDIPDPDLQRRRASQLLLGI